MCIRDRVLDDLLFHRALEGAVEFLQRLAGAKAGAADPVLAAVGLARADLGGEQRLGEGLIGPALLAGALGALARRAGPMRASPRRCSPPRAARASPTAASTGSAAPALAPARRWRNSTAPSSAR